MAAFGTKKPGGNVGLALTFPANYHSAYEMLGSPVSYFPTAYDGPMQLLVGNDFQAVYHQQKKEESNKSVYDGILAMRSAERKRLTGPHGYHVPKAVLGQRKFANPSFGALGGGSSARLDTTDAPFMTVENGMSGSGMHGGRMIGGVVVTSEGQSFYRKQLSDRISQLDRIDAIASGYSVPMGQPYNTQDSTKDGSPSKITFFLYLRALADAIVNGDISRFTFENLKELISMLISFGPTADVEDFNDIIDSLDEMLESVRDGLSEQPEAAEPIDKRQYGETINLFLKAMKKYIDQMARNVNLQPRDRVTLSKSLVKSVGFTQFLRKSPSEANRAIAASDPRAAQEELDMGIGEEDFFDRPAFTREDAEQDMRVRQPFAGEGGDPNRNAFGATRGLILQPGTGYFGEEETGVDTVQNQNPPFASPLNMAGADPNSSDVPPPSDTSLKDLADDVIRDVLGDAFNQASATDPIESIIEAEYPDVNMFVNAVVEALEERGLTPAQSARALQLTDQAPYFQQFIAENTGDLAPPPPTRHPKPTPTNLNPQLYQPAGVPAAQQLSGPQRIEGLGLPSSRERLREDYRTIAAIKQLGMRLTPPYRPNANTSVANAQRAIIKLIKNRVWDGY